MTVVFALLVLAVVVAGIVVVVKSPVTPRRVAEPAAIADSMPTPLGAAELRRVRFPVVFRGYRMDEVDALLAKLAVQLEPPAPMGLPVIPGTEQQQ